MEFTKTIRRNKIAPKRDIGAGTEPLTVIQFSLLDNVRNGLEEALRPYAEGAQTDESRLGQIIKDHLPPEILQELSALSRKRGSPSTIYVIKNLPEIKASNIPPIKNTVILEKYIKKHSYSSYISKGVAAALNLVPATEQYPLIREGFTTRMIAGRQSHKHAEAVTMLGGVISANKALTRFIDFQTLLEDDTAPALPVSVLIKEGETLISTTLEEFSSKIRKWSDKLNPFRQAWLKPREIAVWAGKNVSDEYRKLLEKHSIPDDVHVEPGDLVLWANDGRIFHQALPGGISAEISRAVISSGFNLPR